MCHFASIIHQYNFHYIQTENEEMRLMRVRVRANIRFIVWHVLFYFVSLIRSKDFIIYADTQDYYYYIGFIDHIISTSISNWGNELDAMEHCSSCCYAMLCCYGAWAQSLSWYMLN